MASWTKAWLSWAWHHGHTDVLPPLGNCRETPSKVVTDDIQVLFLATRVKPSRPVDSCVCRNDYRIPAVCQGSKVAKNWGGWSNPTLKILGILVRGTYTPTSGLVTILCDRQTKGDCSECTRGSRLLHLILMFVGLETAQSTCLQFCSGQLSIC